MSIRAVAKHARVSTATVSRVLNGSGYVSDTVRARVERAIEALHYRPNIHARRLRGMRSRMIALVFTQVTHPFSAEIANAIEDTAMQHGYFAVVGNTHRDSTLFDYYVKTFASYGVEGFVIVPPAITEGVTASLKSISVPYVLIDQRIPELAVDQVITDNFVGAYDLTSHLANIGHRRIAFVVGPQTSQKHQDRRAGYEAALRDHGLPIEEDLIRIGEDVDASIGLELAADLLGKTRPDVLFAASLDLQIGALQAIREAGLRMPDDIAMAGFDDIPYAAYLAPHITAVAQQTRTLGVIAAQLLLDKLSGKRPLIEHETVSLRPRLIIRGRAAAPSK